MLGTPTSELQEMRVSIATDQRMYIGSVRDPVAGCDHGTEPSDGQISYLFKNITSFAEPEKLCLLQNVQTGPGVHPASQMATIS
jgi:hypothetical protein